MQLIVYRDGGEGIENGKLCNTSLHVLYISLVSVCTPQRYFVHNYLTVTTAFSYYHQYSFIIITLYSTMNINHLCGILYSVSHRVLIIINRHGSTHLNLQ